MPSMVTIDHSPPQSVASAAASPRGANLWLNVVSHLDPKYGGLSSVVPQLCAAINDTGLASTSIAAFCLPGEEMNPACVDPESTSLWPTSRFEWLSRSELRRRFRRAIGDAEGIHIHGLWEQSTNIAAHNARSMGKPYVVSAHGMLEPWALANKQLKKRVYTALFERRNLDGAACLHALTRAEFEDYRNYGCTNPIVVIPNAVHFPAVLNSGLFFSAYPLLRGKTLILFLGRIHHKKGPDLLIGAWAQLARKWPEAHLVLAGPDSENTRVGLERNLADAGISERVTFTGMLDDAMKWSAYAAAACFVLPSYSEGLSTAVLEAMAAGLPIILTEQSHMPEVAEHQAGYTIQPRVDDLTDALTAVLSASPGQRQEIGRRGRTLVEQNYSWPSVAGRMGEVYRWLAGGPLPESVHLQKAARA